jgi:cytoskeletal protein CcmA (bactofilin family)
MRTSPPVPLPSPTGTPVDAGIALLTVLLLTAVVSGMAITVAFSGRTHVLAGRNNELHAQARAAAEAGLSHGVEVTLANLAAFRTNGFASPSAAMTALLRGPDNLTGSMATDADNGSLEAFGLPRPPGRVALGSTAGVAYEVRLFDDDDAARGVALSNDDVVRIGENNSPWLDLNTQIVLQSTGYAPEGTSVTLEIILSRTFLPAIVVNGDLTIVGNSDVLGRMGSVHANGDLSAAGSVFVEQNMTASGTYTAEGTVRVGNDFGGGRPPVSVPPVNASDHVALANYVMTANGRILDTDGALLCQSTACGTMFGWDFTGADGWHSSGQFIHPGTYYVQGNAKISGNAGTSQNPVSLTLIAEGSIEISGNPDLRPHQPELQFVANGDLRITGGIDNPPNVEGIVMVREQLHISGNPTLRGQIIVQDMQPGTSSLVTTNLIAGNPDIIYNGITTGVAGVNVGAWREVR